MMSRRRPPSVALAWVLVAGGAGAVGCGGSEREPQVREAPDLTRAPVAAPVREEPVKVLVDVEPHRSGAALRLDVRATGKSVRERSAFEDPERWTIVARQGDVTLQRLVNGSTEVERIEDGLGGGRWDTVVSFSLVFEVSGDGEVVVTLTPPGSKATESKIEVAALVDEGAVVDADAGPVAGPDGPTAAPAAAKGTTSAAKADAKAAAKADAKADKKEKAKKKTKKKKATRLAKKKAGATD